MDQEHGSETKWHQQHCSPHCSARSKCCPCLDRRVVLRTPEATCRRASEVLLKTSTFIRNLPSFYHMPWEDQFVLIQQNWVPLFVLGMAQEGVDFDLREVPATSLLKKILLNQSSTAMNELGSSSAGASFTEVQKMKNLLRKLWDLDISAKEYAYLKGIILFNSGNPIQPGLPASPWGCGIHNTSGRAVSTPHHSDSKGFLRFASILQLITCLRDIDVDAIEELFFRPILGEATLNVLLIETLYINAQETAVLPSPRV
uniref:NR LBD domain-containing protein n=1 Tax=Junco hyemalis TaxID=40217 RepID=A0A8C5JN48_JUNHY